VALALISSGVMPGAKRTLNCAYKVSGMTFSAPTPDFILVICKLLAGKSALGSSNFICAKSCKVFKVAWIGLLALCGYPT
jgi:hypothetical protein